MSEPERFYLVDGPSYLYRAYHAIGHLSTSRGLPTNATLGMTMMLWKLLREDRPTYMGIAWDAPGPTRPAPAVRGVQAPAPRDAEGPRRADPVGAPVARGTGPAAPRAAGLRGGRHPGDRRAPAPRHADRARAGHGGQGCAPARRTTRSPCSRSSAGPGERVVYDAAKVEEKWGVPPARIPDILALMGDSIDNIPGVPGVGEVTAQKLLREFGSLEALYANLAVVTGPKLRESLAKNRDQAFLSRQLAVLEGALPIEFDLERFRIREPEWERLRALWTELEFTTLLRQVPARAVSLPAEAVPVVDADGLARRSSRAPAASIAVEPVLTGSRAGPRAPRRGRLRAGGGRASITSGPPELPAGVTGSWGTTRRRSSRWARGAGVTLSAGRVDDTAVAAYLLNSGRSGYPLDQLVRGGGKRRRSRARSRRSSPARPWPTRTRRRSPRGPARAPRACGGWPRPRRRSSGSTGSSGSTRRSRCRWFRSSPTWSGSGSGPIPSGSASSPRSSTPSSTRSSGRSTSSPTSRSTRTRRSSSRWSSSRS